MRDRVVPAFYDLRVPSVEDLEAQFKTAQAAVEAYSGEITEKYRAEYPPEVDEKGKALPPTPDLLLERARAWTEAEREHLDGLRTAAREAAVALHRARREAPGHTTGD